jgi:hypothetical protein
LEALASAQNHIFEADLENKTVVSPGKILINTLVWKFNKVYELGFRWNEVGNISNKCCGGGQVHQKVRFEFYR